MSSPYNALVSKVRAKFPGTYDDLSDDDLGKKILDKHPEYKDMVQGDSTATPPPTQPNSMLGGFGRRAWETAKGAYQAVTAPPQSTIEGFIPPGILPAYRMAKGQVDAEVEAGKQTVRQLRGGQFARAGVTAASMLDPFATGSVVDINKLQDEGRQREAIGTGAFDALMLLIGDKIGKEPTASARLSKLTSAVGETGETAQNLKAIMPDIENAVRTKGKPNTIGDFKGIVHDTLGGLEDQFQAGLNKQVPVPQQVGLVVRRGFVPRSRSMAVGDISATPREIAQSLRDQITPNMRKTVAGRADIAEIEAAAKEFEKPWSVRELDMERKARNAELTAFYKKQSGGQSAATTSRVKTLIDKTVRDGASNIVYKVVDLGNPGMDTTALKLKEKAAWHLDDQLNKHIGKLEDKQLANEGKSIGEKIKTHAYATGGGVRAHISGLSELIPGGGPMEYANAKVAKSFKPTTGATARRAAILALPIERLAGEQTQRKDLPPPPEPTEAPEP